MSTSKTCLLLWERGQLRKAHVREMIGIENRMRGLVRSSLGFNTFTNPCPKLKKQAEKIVSDLLAGKDEDMNRSTSYAGFVRAYNDLAKTRKDIELTMEKAVQTLPVYSWFVSNPGIGDLSFATLVAETVDICDYDSPAKVWKRMGVAVIGGGRQRKVRGEDAIEHGYNAERRSVLWNIGKRIMMQKNRKPDHPWVVRYVEAKEAALAKGWKAGHADSHARRLATKRMLVDLWKEWWKAEKGYVPRRVKEAA